MNLEILKGTPFDPARANQDPTQVDDPLEEEGGGIFNFGDLVKSPFRGFASAIEGVGELGNIIPGVSYDIPENLGLGNSETVVGSLVEGISQFIIPYVGVGGRIASGVSKTANFAGRAAAATAKGKKAAAMSWSAAGKVLPATVAGGVVDFAAFDGLEGRMADLVNKAPWLRNPISEALATDIDDSQLVGRLKNTVEGGLIGMAADSLIEGVKALRAYKRFKERAEKVQPGVTKDKDAWAKFRTMAWKVRQEIANGQVNFGQSYEDAVAGAMARMGLDPDTARPNVPNEEAWAHASATGYRDQESFLEANRSQRSSPDIESPTVDRKVDDDFISEERYGELIDEYVRTGQAGVNPRSDYGIDHGFWMNSPRIKEKSWGRDPKEEIFGDVTREEVAGFIEANRDILESSGGNKIGVVIYQNEDGKKFIDLAIQTKSEGEARFWAGFMGGGEVFESHRSGDYVGKLHREQVEGIPLPEKGEDILSQTDGRRNRKKRGDQGEGGVRGYDNERSYGDEIEDFKQSQEFINLAPHEQVAAAIAEGSVRPNLRPVEKSLDEMYDLGWDDDFREINPDAFREAESQIESGKIKDRVLTLEVDADGSVRPMTTKDTQYAHVLMRLDPSRKVKVRYVPSKDLDSRLRPMRMGRPLDNPEVQTLDEVFTQAHLVGPAGRLNIPLNAVDLEDSVDTWGDVDNFVKFDAMEDFEEYSDMLFELEEGADWLLDHLNIMAADREPIYLEVRGDGDMVPMSVDDALLFEAYKRRGEGPRILYTLEPDTKVGPRRGQSADRYDRMYEKVKQARARGEDYPGFLGLFSPKGTGVDVGEKGVIELLTDEPETALRILLHERLHAVRENLLDPSAGHFTLEEIQGIHDAFGVPINSKGWPRDADEELAEAWEHYLENGLYLRRNDPKSQSQQLFLAYIARRMKEIGNTGVLMYFDPTTREIPEAVLKMFDRLTELSMVDEVLAVIDREAAELFYGVKHNKRVLRGGAVRAAEQAGMDGLEPEVPVSQVTPAQKRMDRFTERMNDKYGEGWESDTTRLDESDRRKYRTNLTLLSKEEQLVETSVEGVMTFREIEETFQQVEMEIDVISAQIETLADVSDVDAVRLRDIADPEVRAEVRDLLKDLKAIREEHKILGALKNPDDFGWEKAYNINRETNRKGKPVGRSAAEAAKRQRPQSSESEGVMNMTKRLRDTDSHEAALDMTEDMLRQDQDYFEGLPDEIREAVYEREARIGADLLDATGNVKSAEHLRKNGRMLDKAGREFLARLRVTRTLGEANLRLMDESMMAYRAAIEAGDADEAREALANLLYYYGQNKLIFIQMKKAEYISGAALGANKTGAPWDAFPTMERKITDPALQSKVIEGVDEFLKQGGSDLDTFLTRLEAVIDEGVLNLTQFGRAQAQSRFDPFMELWYNSLLSGPRTQLVNLDGNILMGMIGKFTRSLGRKLSGSEKKTVGMLFSIFKFHKEAMRMAKVAFAKGAPQLDPNRYQVFNNTTGAFDGSSVVSTGRFADAVGAGNAPGPMKGFINAVARVIAVNGWPTKLLGATDEYFKQIHHRSMVWEQLTNEGMEKGLEGQALSAFINREFDHIIRDGNFYSQKNILMKAYSDAVRDGLGKDDARKKANEVLAKEWNERRGAMAQKALEYSRFNTFTNANDAEVGANMISRTVQRIGRNLQTFSKDIPIVRLIAPFINTPANLLSIAADYTFSPIFDSARFANRGLHKAGAKEVPGLRNLITKELGEWDDKDAEALGRLTIAAGSMAIMAPMVMAGLITGGGPSDPARRKTLRESGWQPYSVKFGDKWVSYGRLDPVASFVSILADAIELLGDDPYLSDPDLERNLMGVLVATTMAGGRNLKEKSFLSGFINFNATIANPEFYSNSLLTDMGANVVPNLVNQVSGEIDPVMRETRGLMDKILYRTPWRTRLTPKRNVLGEELDGYDYRMMGVPGSGLINPFAHSSRTDSAVKKELALYGKGINPPETVRYGQVDMEEYKNPQGQNAYDRWMELHGEVKISGRKLEQALKETIKSPQYRALAPMGEDEKSSPRMDALKKVIFRYRRAALEQVMREYPNFGTNHERARQNAAARRLGRPEQALLDIID